jgi:hypothetical protein
LIFSEAKTRVGASESRQARLDGAHPLERGGRVVPGAQRADRLEERARLLGQAERRLPGREALEDRAQLQERVVAEPRHRAVGGDAVGVDDEAEDALLGAAQAVEPPAVVVDDAPAALVEEEVAADLVGVGRGQPLRALRPAGLLVHQHHDEERSVRRPPALLRERGRGDHLGRGLRLHVERAATPDEAVGVVPRPRVMGPLRRRREHRVDVREQAQHGTRAIAVQARDEVGTLMRAAEELAGEARAPQDGGEVLLRGALVAGRVDGVEADQAL